MIGLLMGLKIAILVTHGFQQSEMIKPKQALEDAGAVVHIIAPEPGKVRGWHWEVPEAGDEFAVDVTLDKADARNYDALVLPGGLTSPDDLRLDENAISFVKGFANKPIAAICHGPWMLIDAQLLHGRVITSWRSIKQDIINAGASWLDKEVVVDGNLVTSRMPDDIPAFNKAMIELFASACSRKKSQNAYTVMVIAEAKPGKEAFLKRELLDAAELSRKERACIEYRVHQDITNPALFTLYEQWASKEAHQQQFEKPYIIALVKKLDDLLSKPFQAIFAEEI